MFFEKVVPPGSFRVIASGDRGSTFRDFCEALRQHPNDYIILLVDSEAPVAAGPWQHLAAREGDRWRRPNEAADDQAQLMVQVMESWFFADKAALAAYYGHGFLGDSLPGQTNIELISKRDVFRALEHASQHTQKGRYRKTAHGFDLIEKIDPSRLRAASGHASRLFDVLERETTR
ncbi:MAG: DUF4276 family protein [Candidatus Korobacteraceae bacterium]